MKKVEIQGSFTTEYPNLGGSGEIALQTTFFMSSKAPNILA